MKKWKKFSKEVGSFNSFQEKLADEEAKICTQERKESAKECKRLLKEHENNKPYKWMLPGVTSIKWDTWKRTQEYLQRCVDEYAMSPDCIAHYCPLEITTELFYDWVNGKMPAKFYQWKAGNLKLKE